MQTEPSFTKQTHRNSHGQILLCLLTAALFAIPALAATRYVNLNNPAPAAPYTDWATAATNIQDAIDAAQAGDTVLVTNGIYATGVQPGYTATSNRIVVNKAVTVRSVNGPDTTIIDGGGSYRCVYITNDATLVGFTLTNGAGGVRCESSAAMVSNCIITGNRGVGAHGGTLNNCTLRGNSPGAEFATLNRCALAGNVAYDFRGGGAIYCELNHCTLVGNSSDYGGGASDSTLKSCTLIDNSARDSGGGTIYCELQNCLLLDNGARFYGGGAYDSTLRNCTVVNNRAQYAGGMYYSTSINSIVYFNQSSDGGDNFLESYFMFSCTFPKPEPGYGWAITNNPGFRDLDGGDFRLTADSPCIDAGMDLSALISHDINGLPRPLDGNRDGGAEFDIGAYELHLALVWRGSPNPSSPYATWDTAAHTIQAACGLGTGTAVLVTNGVYPSVVIPVATTVHSVNGPGLTTIVGRAGSGLGGMGPGAQRAAYLSSGAILKGFTLSFGFTDITDEENDLIDLAGVGGGVYCQDGAVLEDCVISNNTAWEGGGGVFGGKLNRCVLLANTTFNIDGGGAWYSELHGCMLLDNACDRRGGGASDSTLYNCIVRGNSSDGWGGGAARSTLYNCTVTKNVADDTDSGCCGGGTYDSDVFNCIIYYNSGGHDHRGGLIQSSCTRSLVSGMNGNITNEPAFMDLTNGNLRLQSNSPCINAGLNICSLNDTDLDGLPRIAGGTVDIGAYEFQSPASTLSYAWLLQYGFPLDGSADTADSDADQFDNYHEWRAGTDPTNALSLLRLLTPQPVGSDLLVSWQSVLGRNYVLERSSDLGATPAFVPLATGLPGQTNTTSYTDANAAVASPFFYRVRVQE